MPRQPVPAGSSWEPVAQQLLSVFPTGPPTRAARHGEGAPIHHVKSSQVKSKRKELKLESIGTLRKKEGQASSQRAPYMYCLRACRQKSTAARRPGRTLVHFRFVCGSAPMKFL